MKVQIEKEEVKEILKEHLESLFIGRDVIFDTEHYSDFKFDVVDKVTVDKAIPTAVN